MNRMNRFFMRRFFEEDGGAGGAGGTGGSGSLPAWMAQLPDDLKGNADLAKFKSIGELGKSFIDVNSKAANAVSIPGENATPEERAAFYDRIGRPKSPDEYGFETPKVPEGMTVNEELSKAFMKTAHDNGLTKAQAQALFDLYNGHAVKQFEAAAAARREAAEKGVTALKGEWKENYDANIQVAKRAYKKFASEEMTKWLDEGNGFNPVVVKTFYEIGKKMLDDSIVDGKAGTESREKGVFTYDNSPELNK